MESAMQMTLEELRAFITERWPFDAAEYPELGMSADHEAYDAIRMKFAIEHILKHLNESVGTLARFSQKFDHREIRLFAERMDGAEGRKFIASVAKDLLLSTLRLVDVCGAGNYVDEEIYFWSHRHPSDPQKK